MWTCSSILKTWSRGALALFVLAGALLLAGAGAAAAAEPCLECHDIPGLAAKGRSLWVHGDLFVESVHGRLYCTDCHKELGGYPHRETARVRCDLPCHVPGASHEARSRNVVQSVHGKLYDPPCLACHSGGGAAREEDSTARCRSCHAGLDQPRALYPDTPGALADRAHARIVDAEQAPDCLGCHGAHDVGPGVSARASCNREGCHPNAHAGFGTLFDHGGEAERRPWGGADRWLLFAGAAILALLLAHALRG